MQNPPLVSALGIAYAYFPVQVQPGDGAVHQLLLTETESLGNDSLFSEAERGISLAHRAMVSVDVHAKCEHQVAIERHLSVQLDKGASGGLMERGTSCFVAGLGNAAYQGILEAGHLVRASVQAPGDEISIQGGYISVVATPV